MGKSLPDGDVYGMHTLFGKINRFRISGDHSQVLGLACVVSMAFDNDRHDAICYIAMDEES